MSFIERIRAATFGFNGYARLGRDNASGFGFMAFILVIVMTISCVYQTVQFTSGLGKAGDELAKIPDFTFSNGEVQFHEKMPYVIEDGASDMIIVVDTTGKTGPDVLAGRTQGILITKNRYYQVQPGRGLQEIDLSTMPFTFSKSTVIAFVQKMWIGIPIGYVFVFLFQLGFKALDACILGAVALIWGSSTRRKVDFGLGFKLGLYAMTIPTVLQWLIPGYSTFPFKFPIGTLGFFAWWAIAIIYLIFGLQAYFREQDDSGQPYYAGNP